MSTVLRIAADEWRMWHRSRLAIAGLAIFALVLATTTVLTATRMRSEAHHRADLQTKADGRFTAQPDRHPHRMVHYGHYVFRPPAPLSLVDPGIDAVTGEAIFLEGHRQNTTTFADAMVSANVGGFGQLTPALLYQVFLPLLLIALGHGVILRERETGTLATMMAQGTSVVAILLGKALALIGVIVVFLLPGTAAAWIAIAGDESAAVVAALMLSYGVYFLTWAGAIVLASMVFRDRGVALGVLLATWLAWTLIVPRLGVAVTSARLPSPSKVETDLRMQADIRRAGDGHNAADPAFARLRSRLLAEHSVERVEDLPVNIRGVVAEASEAKLTKILNRYAESRMARESEQAKALAAFGWLSPTVALATASRILAGTDIATHHRFQREAEALRFNFVQGLNQIHAQKLAYADDIRRSSDKEAERRTRVDAENWSLLKRFALTRSLATERISSALPACTMLAVWTFIIMLSCWTAAMRLRP